MKRTLIKWTATTAGLLASLAAGSNAQAQSSDALIDKLVDKGILTVKEANELREEADKGFTTSYQVKSGMPDWITSMKINGDFRGRFEAMNIANDYVTPAGTAPSIDRYRYRYRLRLGAVATFRDSFEVGLRLTSSEPSGNFGGDPISGNTTLKSNGSKKFIYLDQAYGKWMPINNAVWTSAFTLGKMENPFVFSDLVWDADYTPEGFAQQFGYNINNNHVLKLNLGEFVIDELANSKQDPYLFGAQLRMDSSWTPKWSSTMGIAMLTLTDVDQLKVNGSGTASAAYTVPDMNAGNSRDGNGVLMNKMRPFVVDGAVTYSLASFPAYTGAFPIRLGGDYMNNTGASKANEAFSVGVTFGKAGKKKTWEVGYRWKELQGDAWFEELVDSDFGAVYRPLFGRDSSRIRNPNTGAPKYTDNTYRAGTNVRGHVMKAAYSPYDSLTFGITYFLTETIDEWNPNSVQTGRLQLDAVWKF